MERQVKFGLPVKYLKKYLLININKRTFKLHFAKELINKIKKKYLIIETWTIFKIYTKRLLSILRLYKY